MYVGGGSLGGVSSVFTYIVLTRELSVVAALQRWVAGEMIERRWVIHPPFFLVPKTINK